MLLGALGASPASPDQPTTGPSLPLTLAWSTLLDTLPLAPPSTDGTVVVVALRDGTIRAISVDDGRSLWHAPIAARERPVLDEGLLYVPTERGLTVLTAAGSFRWERTFPDATQGLVAARGGWVVLGLETGTLVALSGSTGEVVWQRSNFAALAASPTFAADRLYAPLADGRVVSLELADGRTLWERRLIGRPGEVLALQERVYVGTSANLFYCLDARDGTIAWRWRFGAAVVGPAAFAGRAVFLVALDNTLRRLDWRTGVQRWIRPLAFRPSAGPRIIGELVLVPTLGSELPLFLQRDGRPAGSLSLSADLAAPPIAVQTAAGPVIALVTGAESGPPRLHAVRRASDPPLMPLTWLPGASPLEPPLAPLRFLPGRPLVP